MHPENSGNLENSTNRANQEKAAGSQNVAADDGLRRLLTWTFIALGITLVLAAIAVTLVIYFFDPGANW